jgi:hypothetical protein
MLQSHKLDFRVEIIQTVNVTAKNYEEARKLLQTTLEEIIRDTEYFDLEFTGITIDSDIASPRIIKDLT